MFTLLTKTKTKGLFSFYLLIHFANFDYRFAKLDYVSIQAGACTVKK